MTAPTNDTREQQYTEAIRSVPGVPAGAHFSGEFTDAVGNRVGYIGDGAIFEDYARAAMAVADAERRAVTSGNELLTQALWDVWVALGHDTDGDTGPGAFIAGMGLEGFVRMVVSDATEYRRECEEEPA